MTDPISIGVGIATNALGSLVADGVKKTLGYLPSAFGDRVRQSDPPKNVELSKYNDELMASKSYTCAFNEIMEALKDDKVKTIGVWGIGGVGKTTLVTQVGYTAESLQLFRKVIKVVVSQAPDIGKIQDKIANSFGLKLENTTPEEKAGKLWSRLEKEEKVLIILDDMWGELNLKDIGVPFAETRKGFKIIFTTHHRQVCISMKSQVTVSLDVLDEDEAWNLFKRDTISLENASPDIIEVAKEVTKECSGLPIAIVTLARALRSTEHLNGWKLALDKLKRSRLTDIESVLNDVDKNAYLCLKMSYDYLGSPTTKKCFLLCSLYPEDYSIDVEDLVRNVRGLMLYEDAGSVEEVRNEVLEAINKLKDACLLLEDDPKKLQEDRKRYIKLHDVVRDVARCIALKEDNGLLSKPAVESENESSRRKLEILFVENYDSETSTECFEGMRKLKVLTLRRSSKSNASIFYLNTLKSLTNLRALQLEGFRQAEGISYLAKLTKLEILNLHGAEFQESIDILGHLQNLRVLDLCQCKFLWGLAPSTIQRLVKLEELYLFDSTIKRQVFKERDGFERRRTIVLAKLNSSHRLASLSLEGPSLHCLEDFVFPGLERYKIAIDTRCLTDPTTAVSSRISEGLPLNVISDLLWDVEILGVSNSMEKVINFLTDTTPGIVPVATILQNLKEVTFANCFNLQVIFQMKKTENHALLSGLKFLHLRYLPKLQCIWNIPTQHVSLRSLEAVHLSNCCTLLNLQKWIK